MPTTLRQWLIVGLLLIAVCVGSFSAVHSSLAAPSTQTKQNGSPLVESKAGTWKTWVLTSGSQFRLPAPPDHAATADEIKQLKDLVSQRDAKALDQIAYWDTGGPSYRWNQIVADEAVKNNLSVVLGYRDMALVHVAIYDGIIAAWDTKYTFNRPRPSDFDSSLTTVIPNPQSPAYPSEYAVSAAAASDVLAYLFPDDAKMFQDQANQAAQSRLLAGVDYPSDVQSGLDLGHKVAALVIARGKADGSDAKWTGSVPTEKGKWNGTNPAFPMAGTWKTWVLTSGDEFRPGPPPAYDSDQEKADLAELENLKPTAKQISDANFWQFGVGPTRGEWFFGELTGRLVLEYHLDADPPRAARAFALENIAAYDAMVACWDAKYTYWAIRPFQLDPNFKPLFPTPNHPSYPAAHATISTGITDVLAYLFPRDADTLTSMAQQAGESRIWAGIHFRTDVETGFKLGHQVSQAIVAAANSDGSE